MMKTHQTRQPYAVQNDGSVTMTYVDGNGNPVANDEAKSLVLLNKIFPTSLMQERNHWSWYNR